VKHAFFAGVAEHRLCNVTAAENLNIRLTSFSHFICFNSEIVLQVRDKGEKFSVPLMLMLLLLANNC
jgi:hypothetical protein